MQTHFLDEVTDYTGEQTVEKHQPKELFDAGLSSDVLSVVREAMIQVATSGTASSVFAGYPVPVACKTGTAETSPNPDEGGTQANLSFICYAPAYDPEIAVAVMLEYGQDGDYAKNVAKDILDQYFGYYTWDEDGNRFDQNGNLVDDKGEILKTKEEWDRQKATEEGESSSSQPSDPSSSQDPDASSASSGSNRDNIPDAPFTGGASSSPDASSPESGVSSKEESGTPESSGSGDEPDSPYDLGDG